MSRLALFCTSKANPWIEFHAEYQPARSMFVRALKSWKGIRNRRILEQFEEESQFLNPGEDFMKRTFRMLGMMLAIGACLSTTRPSFAALVPLADGSTAVPTGGTVSGDLPSYSVALTTSYLLTNGPVAATIYAEVIKVGSTYDFLFQVANTGTSPIDGLTVQNYGSYATSVDYLTDGSNLGGSFTDGGLGTFNVNRTSDGSSVSFNFDVPGPSGTSLAPGATSDVLLVATTAPHYDELGTTTASATVSGSGSATIGFVIEPSATAIPEPGSLVLGSLALIFGAGVYGFRRRK
jgi:hypothetical protein